EPDTESKRTARSDQEIALPAASPADSPGYTMPHSVSSGCSWTFNPKVPKIWTNCECLLAFANNRRTLPAKAANAGPEACSSHARAKYAPYPDTTWLRTNDVSPVGPTISCP